MNQFIDKMNMNKSDKNQKDKALKDIMGAEGKSLIDNSEETITSESESKTDNLAEQIEVEKQKSAELKDSYVRLMAEFDNYRKRTLREKSDILKFSGENILTALLPIVDDFERAMEAMQTSTDIDINRKGIELIYEKLLSFLTSQGVKSIDTASGSDFDTEYHEAVTTIPATEEDLRGKIIDCIQKGYTLNDKVIRFSKVVVGE